MMKLSCLPILVLLYLVPTAQIAGPIEKVAELIKKGDSRGIAQYFATSVDISVLDNTNIYSKAQAELILDKFFKENKPLSVKVLHRINSNSNYNFGVLILTTDKGKYRVSYTMKDIEKTMEIIELRIEPEKT